MKKTISIILAAVMLTGCAKTPDNVKSSSAAESSVDSSQVQSSAAEKKQLTKTMTEKDFAACTADSKSVILAGSYDNLKIDPDFRVIANAYPMSYQAVVPSDYDKYADQLFSLFLPDDTQGYYKDKKQLHADENTGVRSYEYTNGKSTGFVSSNGCVSIVDNEYMNKAVYGSSSPVNETRNLLMPVTSDTMPLGTASIDLRDAQHKTAETLALLFTPVNERSKVDCKFDHQLYSVSTVTEQSGETLAFVHCRQTIDGVPIFDIVSRHGQFDTMPVYSGPVAAINAKGDVVQINNSLNFNISSAEKLPELVTAEYAFETASKALAPHLDHTARVEELVLVPTVSASEEGSVDLKQGDTVTLTPYWVIHFETDWWTEVYAAVNAVTGEVHYVNNRE